MVVEDGGGGEGEAGPGVGFEGGGVGFFVVFDYLEDQSVFFREGVEGKHTCKLHIFGFVEVRIRYKNSLLELLIDQRT